MRERAGSRMPLACVGRDSQGGQLRRTQLPQRSKLAEIAVAIRVHGQQRDRHTWRISKFLTRNATFHVQRHADNRLEACVLRFRIKRHRRIHAVRIRQRHGGHVLFDRRCNDLVGRRHAPQERIMTVTMQIDKHWEPRELCFYGRGDGKKRICRCQATTGKGLPMPMTGSISRAFFISTFRALTMASLRRSKQWHPSHNALHIFRIDITSCRGTFF